MFFVIKNKPEKYQFKNKNFFVQSRILQVCFPKTFF